MLFNDTIGYNIGYGKREADASKEEIVHAAKRASLDGVIEHMPERLVIQLYVIF